MYDLFNQVVSVRVCRDIGFVNYNPSQLFTFADRFRGLYDDSIPSASNFYTSSGYGDELLWAAAWLCRATKDNYYLKYVVDNAASMGGTGQPSNSPGTTNMPVSKFFYPSDRDQRGDETFWYPDGNKIVQSEFNPANAYGFDRVFGPDACTQDVCMWLPDL